MSLSRLNMNDKMNMGQICELLEKSCINQINSRSRKIQLHPRFQIPILLAWMSATSPTIRLQLVFVWFWESIPYSLSLILMRLWNSCKIYRQFRSPSCVLSCFLRLLVYLKVLLHTMQSRVDRFSSPILYIWDFNWFFFLPENELQNVTIEKPHRAMIGYRVLSSSVSSSRWVLWNVSDTVRICEHSLTYPLQFESDFCCIEEKLNSIFCILKQ